MNADKRLLFLAFVVCAMTLGTPPARADTSFQRSVPADGEAMEQPVEAVTLIFSDEAEPTGAGFQALDGDGAIREPSQQTTADGATWELAFDPPLGGEVIVRWEVKAADAHLIEGSVSFRAPLRDPTGSSSASEDAPEQTPGSLVGTESAIDASAFEAGSGGGSWKTVGLVGRLLSMLGVLVGVGSVAFVLFVLRGVAVADARSVVFWIRRTGVMVALGSLFEFAGQVGAEGSVGSVLFGSFGLAVLLRMGGGAMLVTTRAEPRPTDPSDRSRASALSGAASRVVTAAGNIQTVERVGAVTDRLRFGRGTMFGCLAALSAFLFDGHTVTKGWRPLTAVIDLAHVTSAAVWVGGVMTLTGLLWRRRHRDDVAGRVQLVLSFSGLASVALAVVGIAGIALTASIVESTADLFTTQWGRVLIAKAVLVGLAATAGAYNHFQLLPKLANPATRVHALRAVKEVVLVEAVALASVAGLSAWLVGSSL